MALSFDSASARLCRDISSASWTASIKRVATSRIEDLGDLGSELARFFDGELAELSSSLI